VFRVLAIAASSHSTMADSRKRKQEDDDDDIAIINADGSLSSVPANAPPSKRDKKSMLDDEDGDDFDDEDEEIMENGLQYGGAAVSSGAASGLGQMGPGALSTVGKVVVEIDDDDGARDYWIAEKGHSIYQDLLNKLPQDSDNPDFDEYGMDILNVYKQELKPIRDQIDEKKLEDAFYHIEAVLLGLAGDLVWAEVDNGKETDQFLLDLSQLSKTILAGLTSQQSQTDVSQYLAGFERLSQQLQNKYGLETLTL